MSTENNAMFQKVSAKKIETKLEHPNTGLPAATTPKEQKTG